MEYGISEIIMPWINQNNKNKKQKKAPKNPKIQDYPHPPNVHNSTVLVDQPRSDYNCFLYVPICTVNPVIFAVI